MVEVIFCLKPARRAELGDYHRKVDAGRRSNQPADLRGGHSHGLHAPVWEVGDQTEGITKCWRLRVCLH